MIIQKIDNLHKVHIHINNEKTKKQKINVYTFIFLNRPLQQPSKYLRFVSICP